MAAAALSGVDVAVLAEVADALAGADVLVEVFKELDCGVEPDPV